MYRRIGAPCLPVANLAAKTPHQRQTNQRSTFPTCLSSLWYSNWGRDSTYIFITTCPVARKRTRTSHGACNTHGGRSKSEHRARPAALATTPSTPWVYAFVCVRSQRRRRGDCCPLQGTISTEDVKQTEEVARFHSSRRGDCEGTKVRVVCLSPHANKPQRDGGRGDPRSNNSKTTPAIRPPNTGDASAAERDDQSDADRGRQAVVVAAINQDEV